MKKAVFLSTFMVKISTISTIMCFMVILCFGMDKNKMRNNFKPKYIDQITGDEEKIDSYVDMKDFENIQFNYENLNKCPKENVKLIMLCATRQFVNVRFCPYLSLLDLVNLYSALKNKLNLKNLQNWLETFNVTQIIDVYTYTFLTNQKMLKKEKIIFVTCCPFAAITPLHFTAAAPVFLMYDLEINHIHILQNLAENLRDGSDKVFCYRFQRKLSRFEKKNSPSGKIFWMAKPSHSNQICFCDDYGSIVLCGENPMKELGPEYEKYILAALELNSFEKIIYKARYYLSWPFIQYFKLIFCSFVQEEGCCCSYPFVYLPIHLIAYLLRLFFYGEFDGGMADPREEVSAKARAEFMSAFGVQVGFFILTTWTFGSIVPQSLLEFFSLVSCCRNINFNVFNLQLQSYSKILPFFYENPDLQDYYTTPCVVCCESFCTQTMIIFLYVAIRGAIVYKQLNE